MSAHRMARTGEPETITADGLAEHNVRIARIMARRLDELISTDANPGRVGDLVSAMCSRAAVAFLLREIHPASEADNIARRMWELLGDGSEVEEFLAICAEEYGLDQ